ncbi:GntR family transcriptional regulator [Arthrobacter livingstonensis]|uniref:GntR family transcriptional regulator n=1 Tax=Arthrobacter livingstonensis TaxID=670078 RepID=A0A2V5L7B9_9MICC|nr:GntR family transcriptional regulator [Arthrobacter livingstonensis]PYI65493.1 GntR family transcriptional regulator [Arthrobacter livingstonensis]
MLFRIDPSSEATLFAQLAASVRTDAAAGRLRPGDRLPAAREVAASLGINVHTVLHAYQDLREEGLVDMRRGRGAVVTDAAEPLASLHSEILSLARSARELGLSPDAIASLVKEAALEP